MVASLAVSKLLLSSSRPRGRPSRSQSSLSTPSAIRPRGCFCCAPPSDLTAARLACSPRSALPRLTASGSLLLLSSSRPSGLLTRHPRLDFRPMSAVSSSRPNGRSSDHSRFKRLCRIDIIHQDTAVCPPVECDPQALKPLLPRCIPELHRH